jgi:hypothetical protein
MNVGSTNCRCGRGFWNKIDDGEITIKNACGWNGKNKRHHTYIIKKGDVKEAISTYIDEKGEKRKTHTIYGVGQKTWINGRLKEEERYKPGSNQAMIFKGTWKTETGKLEGKYDVVLKRKCYGGSFRGEVCKYKKNNKIAYKVGSGMNHAEVYYPNGKLWLKLTCFNNSKLNFGYKDSIFGKDISNENDRYTWHQRGRIYMTHWNYNDLVRGGNYEVVVYDTEGKIQAQGKSEARQKVGIWIEDYNPKYYLVGVSVSEKMFNAKPEDMDPNEILNLDNAQLRTSLMTKMGMERFLKECKAELFHEDGDMQLYTLPVKQVKINDWRQGDTILKLLKVRCPSTGTYYVLRVHPDTKTCEEAKKWTFGFNPDDKIELEVET